MCKYMLVWEFLLTLVCTFMKVSVVVSCSISFRSSVFITGHLLFDLVIRVSLFVFVFSLKVTVNLNPNMSTIYIYYS